MSKSLFFCGVWAEELNEKTSKKTGKQLDNRTLKLHNGAVLRRAAVPFFEPEIICPYSRRLGAK